MADTSITGRATTETWLRDAFDRLRLEAVLFGRTFAAFALHPTRAARAWQADPTDFMNPLAFAASAAAVYWAATSVLAALWPVPASPVVDGVVDHFSSAVTPYVHYGLLGSAMHVALRWLGSGRRILGSIGAAFFTGGSIGTLAALALRAAAQWMAHARGTGALEIRSGDPVPLVFLVAAVMSYMIVCLAMLRALMALHHAARWKAAVAGAFAVAVTSLLFGSLLPYAEYGWHPYLRISLTGGLAVSFGFRS